MLLINQNRYFFFYLVFSIFYLVFSIYYLLFIIYLSYQVLPTELSTTVPRKSETSPSFTASIKLDLHSGLIYTSVHITVSPEGVKYLQEPPIFSCLYEYTPYFLVVSAIMSE